MSGAARRFYEKAEPVPVEGGYGVSLDGRTLRTPGRLVFATPTLALAKACAAEWAAQDDEIRPAAMPLTRLANVAVERTPRTRDAIVASVAKFAETDLVCHRADRPARLVERQSAVWDPLLAWAHGAIGVRLHAVVGIAIDPRNLEAVPVVAAGAAALDDFRLTGLAHAAGLAGSCVIAFAMLHRVLNAAEAAGAAALDEDWALETWGEDAEARARLAGQAAEFAALERFFATLT
jgi:chaperone required for assembly of F1-ATPase